MRLSDRPCPTNWLRRASEKNQAVLKKKHKIGIVNRYVVTINVVAGVD